MADCLFPLTLRMPEKSSAKLGEMEPTTDRRGGSTGCEVRQAGVACMHSPPVQSDGRPDAERNVDSVESLAGSAITPARGEPLDDRCDRRCGQQSR